MGPYCRYCGRRCFVVRVLPDDANGTWAGRSLAMATCADGMNHDRFATGYTHEDGRNPIVQTEQREIDR